MRIHAATAALIALAALVVWAPNGATAAAVAGTKLHVGDQLVYEITVELQQHHVRSVLATQDKTVEISAQGTETFTIYAIARDGTAYANAVANFTGINDGRPIDFRTATTAKVLPDGQLRTKVPVGIGVSEAFGFANTTTQEITQHALSLGRGWKTAQHTDYVDLTMSRKVDRKTTYQGLVAYEVQTVGSGVLAKTTDGKSASGTIALIATSYYDDEDRLLVGEALQTLTVVKQSSESSAHDNYSASMDVVLSSWTHASPAPAVEGAASAGSSVPASTPTPAPALVPEMYAPTPYPTVTPRLGY